MRNPIFEFQERDIVTNGTGLIKAIKQAKFVFVMGKVTPNDEQWHRIYKNDVVDLVRAMATETPTLVFEAHLSEGDLYLGW